MPANVFRVKPEGVHMLWTDVAFLLRDCPSIKLAELHKDLLVGRQQLWVAVGNPHHVADAVILTQKHKYPPLKRQRYAGRPRKDDFPDRWNIPERHVLVIHLASRSNDSVTGTISNWIEPAIKVLEDFARQLNCTELRIVARMGWRPYVKGFGRGFDRVTFKRDRLTLRQFRRKARGLGVQWVSGTKTGVAL
jgi:hypothetical protein